MKNLKIFPKLFIQTLLLLGVFSLGIHLSVYWIFPKYYLQIRQEEVTRQADAIAEDLQGRERTYVDQSLDFFSKTTEMNAFIQSGNDQDVIPIDKNAEVDLESQSNSLIIEERTIRLKNNQLLAIQLVSTADMEKEARALTLSFLPYSLIISVLLSIVISYHFAKATTGQIQSIQLITKRMQTLDRQARLTVQSTNEIGQFKQQINDLYESLLGAMDDLEVKNRQILQLQEVKNDFLRGASHELKTPLASLKIILENMKYQIGKYQDRDHYIDESIKLVDGLSRHLSQILTASSLEQFQQEAAWIGINEVLTPLVGDYQVLASERDITIDNQIRDEEMYIGKEALKLILANLISNGVKYSQPGGQIVIAREGEDLVVENTVEAVTHLKLNQVFPVYEKREAFPSNNLGLSIVQRLLNYYQLDYDLEMLDGLVRFRIRLEPDYLDEKGG